MLEVGCWKFFIHHPTPDTQKINYETVTIFTQKIIPTNFSEQINIGGNFCDAGCTIDCASFSGEL